MDYKENIKNKMKILKKEVKNELIILRNNKLTKKDRKKYLDSIYIKMQEKVDLKKQEKYFQDKLASKLNGQTEVLCQNGIIDILTDDYIIEVKQIKKWKEAVGQVIVYSLNYPSIKKRKRIHLFFNNFKEIIKVRKILISCYKLSIEVSYDYWDFDSIFFDFLEMQNIEL